MSRIAKKLMIPIAGVIIIIMAVSIGINVYFVEGYTLAKQKEALLALSEEVSKATDENEIRSLEEAYNAVVLRTEKTKNSDEFSNALRSALQNDNIGFTKLWLWEDDYDTLLSKGALTKIYNQGWLKYSILVHYKVTGDNITAVAMNVPHTEETISAVNQFSTIVFSLGGVLILVTIVLVLRRDTKPIAELERLTKDITKLNFRKIEVHTGDEIEDLAVSINSMSEQLEKDQKALKAKNETMEELLSNVAHEIKTPVALIKAYLSGIADGMDDGTFLKIIGEQNDKIDRTVETLLTLSHIEKEPPKQSRFSLSELLKETIDEHHVMIDRRAMTCLTQIKPQITIKADKEDIKKALENLLTNAIKYGEKTIEIRLEERAHTFRLTVANTIPENTTIDTKRMWEPFYVGEPSRSKELSGTGLGLAIVDKIMTRSGFKCSCEVCGEWVWFLVEGEVSLD